MSDRPTWFSTLGRKAWWFLRLLLLAGLTMAGLMMIFQDRLLYFPERIELAAALPEAAALRLAPWPNSADVRGWLREPKGNARATLLLFHGNAGHALHRVWLADVLVANGWRVLLAEYPGYGHRAGRLGEASLAGDAAGIIRLARDHFAGPLVVAGESLGAGVAAAAVAQVPGAADAVLLITPWNRLEEVAAHHYPWAPVSLLLRDRYDSAANLAGFRGPKALIVAGSDQVIPPRLGNALYEALPEPRRLWLLRGAGHNDWMEHLLPEQWRALLEFLIPEAT